LTRQKTYVYYEVTDGHHKKIIKESESHMRNTEWRVFVFDKKNRHVSRKP